MSRIVSFRAAPRRRARAAVMGYGEGLLYGGEGLLRYTGGARKRKVGRPKKRRAAVRGKMLTVLTNIPMNQRKSFRKSIPKKKGDKIVFM